MRSTIKFWCVYESRFFSRIDTCSDVGSGAVRELGSASWLASPGAKPKLTGVFDVDTNPIVKPTVRAVDVEVSQTLFLYDAVWFDGEGICVACDADSARTGRVKVVNLFAA